MSQLVLITGASSGIGQALALRYAAAGWRLALLARRHAELLAWAQAQGWSFERYRVYGADVTQHESIFAAAHECMLTQGVPQLVIANAGISVGIDSAEPLDLRVIARTMATNVVGVAATFHPFIKPMRARGSGTLVSIASVAAIRGLPGHGAYCASKAAVVNYCESLRGELRASGVRVVTLLPGYVDTPLTRGNRYWMPFLLTAEQFADKAFRAISGGQSYCVIPWQMAIVSKLLRLMPNAIFDWALAGALADKPRKAREIERKP